MKKLLSAARKKLASIDGETLVETLVSTLIIAAVMLMLCTAIVSAAKVNATIQNDETVFTTEGATEISEGFSLTVNHGGSPSPVPAASYKAFKTKNGYVYYEPTSSN